MQNLINTLAARFEKEIKSFGITEVFVIDGEVCTTSNYELPVELIAKIEEAVFNSNSPQFKVSENYEVGAILYDSWGCEQTNVDFYGIIKRSGLFVTIVKLKSESIYNGQAMTSIETPTMEIDTTGSPIRKKIKTSAKEVWNEETKRIEYSKTETVERGFSLRDYAGADG